MMQYSCKLCDITDSNSTKMRSNKNETDFGFSEYAWICATFELIVIKYTNKTQYVTLSNALVFYHCELKLCLIGHHDHYGLERSRLS